MLAQPTGSALNVYDPTNHIHLIPSAVRTLVQLDATITRRSVVAPQAESCLPTFGV
jgi:conjugal transfer/entry exclusion protein